MNAQHSAKSVEHYTPLDVIDAARRTMGGIDLDPATTALVNAERVKATHFHTKEDDGLRYMWNGRVWLNPPGGLIERESSAAVWWRKLVDEWHAGRVTQALFLGFSIEIMATSQDAAEWVGGAPFCVPRRRLAHDTLVDDGETVGFETGKSPTHSNVIAYLPPRANRDAWVAHFAAEFLKFGKVRT